MAVEEEEIESEIPGFLPEAATKSAPGPLATDESPHSQYLDFLRSRVANRRRFRRLASGGGLREPARAYRLGPELFRALGCDRGVTIGHRAGREKYQPRIVVRCIWKKLQHRRTS